MHSITKISSLSDGFQKQGAIFIKDQDLNEVFIFWTKKKCKSKIF